MFLLLVPGVPYFRDEPGHPVQGVHVEALVADGDGGELELADRQGVGPYGRHHWLH